MAIDVDEVRQRARRHASRDDERLTQPQRMEVGGGGGGAGGCEVGLFRVKYGSDQGDYIVCRTWDGSVEGDTDVPVAKPYLCRRSPFDGQTRDGISYEYSSHVRRTASVGEGEEEEIEVQVLTPLYVAGDEILAVRGISRGTTVFEEAQSGRTASLTTRVDDNTGIFHCTAPPLVAEGDGADVRWGSGVRYAMIVTNVSYNDVTLDGGRGDVLPAQGREVGMYGLGAALVWQELSSRRAFANEHDEE